MKSSMSETLEGQLVKLRALEPEDADRIFEWENNPEFWEVSNTLVPFSKHIIRNYIETAPDIFQAKQIRLMIDLKLQENKTIGTIDLFDFDAYHHRAGVGILISEKENRGKGYALDALKTISTYCFSKLQLHQLYCNILADNIASIALFKKAGFVSAGLKKDWVWTPEGYKDEYLFQLVNE